MILKHLKTRTATLHKETEEDNLAKYVLDHTITLDQYIALLSQNFKAYAAISEFLEHNVTLLPKGLQHFADGKKAEALQRDLDQLNTATPQKLTVTPNHKITSPYLLGMLYVAEGSMLGGLLIRKNLEQCNALDAIKEHHFFGKSATEVLERWKSFSTSVEESNYLETQIDEAVEGAHFGFSIFKLSYQD